MSEPPGPATDQGQPGAPQGYPQQGLGANRTTLSGYRQQGVPPGAAGLRPAAWPQGYPQPGYGRRATRPGRLHPSRAASRPPRPAGRAEEEEPGVAHRHRRRRRRCARRGRRHLHRARFRLRGRPGHDDHPGPQTRRLRAVGRPEFGTSSSGSPSTAGRRAPPGGTGDGVGVGHGVTLVPASGRDVSKQTENSPSSSTATRLLRPDHTVHASSNPGQFCTACTSS